MEALVQTLMEWCHFQEDPLENTYFQTGRVEKFLGCLTNPDFLRVALCKRHMLDRFGRIGMK